MSKTVILGVDTGNFNTKTEHVTFPSGYDIVKNIPTIQGGNYLSYQGKIYIPSDNNRIEYVRDKTSDDTHFILTLMGVGAELMYRLSGAGKNIQQEANKIGEVYLAVGLPPAHHASLAAKYKEYFLRHFGDRTEFEYNGIKFSFRVSMVRVLAQDYTAVMEYSNHTKYARIEKGKFALSLFYAVDIGGKTVDYVEIRDGKPTSFDSFDNGVLTMFKSIEKNLRQGGTRIDDILCEKILRGDNIMVNQKVAEDVKNQAKAWSEKILRELDNDFSLQSSPVIFLGGGSKLLRPFIEQSPLLEAYEFLGGSDINASAYAKFMREYYQKELERGGGAS